MGQKKEEIVIEYYHRNIKISDIYLKFQLPRTEYQKQRKKETTFMSNFRSESPGYPARMVSTGYREVDIGRLTGHLL